MPEYTLTVLEAADIQDYILDSNILRENIGGSELVRCATRLWPFEQVQKMNRSNIKADRQPTGGIDDLDINLRIEVDELRAEIVYAGGGSCVILFADRENAQTFVTDLSRRLLTEAPGLSLVAAHVAVQWAGDKGDVLANKVQEALDHLSRKKGERRVSTPLLGLGTTVTCRSTGLPAVDVGPDGRPLSANILSKLEVVEFANRRLADCLPQFKEAGLKIPNDFDRFDREAGGLSYIAVVHADGNGLGKRAEGLRRRFQSPADNRRYIETMRAFSRDIEQASMQALVEISTRLLHHWDPIQDAIVGRMQDGWGNWVSVGQVRPGKEGQDVYVPFRPIIFGDDSLTFATDGRLGLTLAVAYLEAFEKAMDARPSTASINACAGIAVVKAHYPFARAYQLAQDLCHLAKREYARQYSALDWHFASAGLFGSIHDIRKRQYTIPATRLSAGSAPPAEHQTRETFLEIRPILLQVQPRHPEGWRAWPRFAHAAQEFLTNQHWQDKWNKVIALREALRDGPEAVERFRATYGLNLLPTLAEGIKALQATGWDGTNRCGYFDILEALDFYLPLDWHEKAY